MEKDRKSLDAKIKQEKELDNLEKLKFLVQKNYEEEQRIIAERALHDKEMDLEALEKLYLDAKRQMILLDVKDAKLLQKVVVFFLD